jgi:hypothetical protein
MSDYPKASKVLLRLMGVGRHDREMPLPILINMYRSQLRFPLMGLLPLASRSSSKHYMVYEVKRKLGDRYPKLRYGTIFQNSTALNEVQERSELITPAGSRQLGEAEMALRKFYMDADFEWGVQEPLVLLYALSLPGTPVEPLLQALEIELGLDRQVERMIHKHARIGRKLA